MHYLSETGLLTVQPFQGVDPGFAADLGHRAASMFDLDSMVGAGLAVPVMAWQRRRRQYRSDALLAELARLAQAAAPGEVLLGVTAGDLFISGLNYIFGEADQGSGVAVISLARLAPAGGGMEGEALFRERAVKEAIHELGHVFGLAHCPRETCIMHFSNTIADTDVKGPGFCLNCSALLFRAGAVV